MVLPLPACPALTQIDLMDTIPAREDLASFLASQDAPTLARVLLELAEDEALVYQRIERLRLQADPTRLKGAFMQRLQHWRGDVRFVRFPDAPAFGHDLDVWISQVEREVLPRFPAVAMELFSAYLCMDDVVFEQVDDDGGYVGGSFEQACQLWMMAAHALGLSKAAIRLLAVELFGKDAYGARRPLAEALERLDAEQG